jgi:hypothetical protein
VAAERNVARIACITIGARAYIRSNAAATLGTKVHSFARNTVTVFPLPGIRVVGDVGVVPTDVALARETGAFGSIAHWSTILVQFVAVFATVRRGADERRASVILHANSNEGVVIIQVAIVEVIPFPPLLNAAEEVIRCLVPPWLRLNHKWPLFKLLPRSRKKIRRSTEPKALCCNLRVGVDVLDDEALVVCIVGVCLNRTERFHEVALRQKRIGLRLKTINTRFTGDAVEIIPSTVVTVARWERL